jgi:hypothetical protein
MRKADGEGERPDPSEGYGFGLWTSREWETNAAIRTLENNTTLTLSKLNSQKTQFSIPVHMKSWYFRLNKLHSCSKIQFCGVSEISG